MTKTTVYVSTLRRVFIAYDTPKYDTRGAEDYGKRVFLLKNELHPLSVHDVVGELQRRLTEMRFNPNEDVVCLTGGTVLVAMLCAVCAKMFDRFTVLVYDAKTSKYVERQVDVS